MKLGNKITPDFSNIDPTILETFENPSRNDYTITFECFEFSSLCPITGQPDFAKLYITYNPNKLCVETKSLKYYLFSFRNAKCFMEALTNKIKDDLVKCLKPKSLTVSCEFNIRGGIRTTINVPYYMCSKQLQTL